jgi:hypothetical protein
VDGVDVTATGDIVSAGTIGAITPSVVQLGYDTFGTDPHFQGAVDDLAFGGRVLSQSDLVAWRSVSQEGAPGMLQRYPLLPCQEVLKLKT